MSGTHYFYKNYLYGPNGYTNVYVHWSGNYGYLYSRIGYTQYYIHKDYIYGPSGWTRLYLHKSWKYDYIYGSDEMPSLEV